MSQTWRKPQPPPVFLTLRKISKNEHQFLSPVLVKSYLILALLALGCLIPASAQTSAFSCSSFASSGACSVAQAGYKANFIVRNGGNLSGNQIDFVPANSIHNGYGLAYYVPLNVQAFNTSFTFVPNGQNFAFIVQNSTTNPGYNGNIFSSGAGCEAGFYQAYGVAPNNVFALEFDSDSWLTEASEAFTYSSVQIYQQNQSPCLPNDGGPNYVPTNKISTYPVPLNSPAAGRATTTGHVYAANVVYDGTNLMLSMYDQTAGGSCPGASCFQHTWAVNIPSWVSGDQAYVGFSAGINIPNLPALYVNSWNYSEGSAVQPPTAVTAPTPSFSPGSGTYSSTQPVTISDGSSSASIYYTTDGSTPSPSSNRYSTPISVSTTETLQAIAVVPGDVNSAVASATYTFSTPTPTPPPPSPPAVGNVIDYSNGFSGGSSQLYLASSAAYSGSSLELTKANFNLANNAWFKTPVNVQAFTTTFTWTDGCPAKPGACGDGMGFMIISNSNPSSAGYNYSGRAGSQLAWSRCSGSSSCQSINSVMVKFDLYNNATGSDGANLTGLYTGGELPQLPQPQFDMAPSGINMRAGHLMKATLSYDGSVLMETVTDTVTGAVYRNSYSVDIPSLVGGNTAIVGFGGGSGGAVIDQKIQSWTYTVN